MQIGRTRLWKQIGCQSDNKHNLASLHSISIENHAKPQKYDNQQFYLPTEQSIIRDNWPQLEQDECCQDCLSQLALLNSQHPLPVACQSSFPKHDAYNRTTSVLQAKQQQKQKQKQGQTKQKHKKCKMAKQAISKIAKQIQNLKQTISTTKTSLSSLILHYQTEHIQCLNQLTTTHIQLQQSQKSQIDILTQRISDMIQKHCKKQRDMQIKINELQKSLIEGRYNQEILKKQCLSMRNTNQKLMIDNQELNQKIFDMEQKVLAIDLEVQKRVAEILKVSYDRKVKSDINQNKSYKGLSEPYANTERTLNMGLDQENFHGTNSKMESSLKTKPRLSLHIEEHSVPDPLPKSPATSLKSIFHPIQKHSSPRKPQLNSTSPVRPYQHTPSQTIKSPKCLGLSLAHMYESQRMSKISQHEYGRNTSLKTSLFSKKQTPRIQRKVPNMSDISSKLYSIKNQIQNQINGMKYAKGKSYQH